MESDEPWQTLAACIELQDALMSPDPSKYVSHLPIHQDGSCNGLQHYAALGRDLQGAQSVNLTPLSSPQDVYSDVAAIVGPFLLFLFFLPFPSSVMQVLSPLGCRWNERGQKMPRKGWRQQKY